MATLTLQGAGQLTSTWMRNDSSSSESGSTVIYVGQSSLTPFETSRGILVPNLTSISAGSTITSAVLTLRTGLYPCPGQFCATTSERPLRLYRILKAVDTVTATWDKYSGNSSWSTAGCSGLNTDRGIEDIGNGPTQPCVFTYGTVVTIILNAGKLQEMIPGGSVSNYGFLLKVDTESDDQVRYVGSNGTTANGYDDAYRPKLVIEYTLPATTTSTSSSTTTTTSTSTTTTSTSTSTTVSSTTSTTTTSTSTTTTSTSSSTTTTSTSTTTTSTSTTTTSTTVAREFSVDNPGV